MKYWIYLLLLLAEKSRHVYTNESRIIRGKDADLGEYPFMARLSIKSLTGYILCGGTLISENLVISATHCLIRAQRPLSVKVILGDHIIGHNDTTEQVLNVKKIFLHKRWDAMILRLDAIPDINNDSVSPVSFRSRRPPVGAMVTAVGWGSNQPGGAGYSTHLQEIQIPVAPRWRCNVELRSANTLPLHSAEMCAGWRNRPFSNVCNGDSGGPLLYKPFGTSTYQLVGIARRVANGKCPNNLHYGMFTSIASISKWIRSKLSCSKAGIWHLINNNSPLISGDDREKPICPDGKTPLCVKCVMKDQSSCQNVHPSCDRKQRYTCSVNKGLTCQRSRQPKVNTRGKRRRCHCCDYAIRVLCAT